jgi:hypothetical protein
MGYSRLLAPFAGIEVKLKAGFGTLHAICLLEVSHINR